GSVRCRALARPFLVPGRPGVTSAAADTVAGVIARVVAGTGAAFAFGHPGGEVVVLMDALQRAGLRYILTHHENTAAFMAGAYAEMTDRPGVCVATLGPGAANMACGVANAFLDRASVLAFTGALALGAPRGTTHQAIDLNALYAPITKATFAVTADSAGQDIRRAVALCRAQRRGPVHLSIPSDVATAACQPVNGQPEADQPTLLPPAQLFARAVSLLRRARRPALLLGVGAQRAGAGPAAVALAHKVGAAVAVTPKGKGLLPEDDPLFAGVLEMAGDDLVIEFLKDADAIVAAGLDVVELDKPWRLSAPMIHVGALPNQEGYYPAEVELVGEVPAILERLAADSVSAQGWSGESIENHRRGLRAYLCPRAEHLQPWQVVDAVRAALPRNAVAATDVGIHKFLGGQLWQTFEARTFFMSNGLSAMGYGLPTAATACLVWPDRPAVVFVGDGGLGMYLGELETIRRLGLDLLVVVMADGSLELIRRSQMRREVSLEGTSFTNPDFVQVARAFGGQGYEVQSLSDLKRAVNSAARSKGLRLIAARIDGGDYRV
ncbi:MAG: thiamine pyrophosphate-binding protein, partial [Chloroflexota bacterium]